MPDRSSRNEAPRRNLVLSAVGNLLWLMLRRPRDSALSVVAIAAVGTIIVNGLFMQPGPHPAPMFALRPLPVADTPTGTVAPATKPQPAETPAVRPRAVIISDVQRELTQRGYYDGTVDGAYGAKTDAAIREFERASGLPSTGEPTEALLASIQRAAPKAQAAVAARRDPIADLLAPQGQMLAIQRALTEFGYGPVPANGVYGPETRIAIERFERDRRMPVTGQMSDRLARELSSMTGRPL